jgi:biotin carboxyl carrier protein
MIEAEIKEKLTDLLDFAKRKELHEVVWQDGDVKIAFRRGGSGSSAESRLSPLAPGEAAPQPEPSKEAMIRSPMVGIFRRSNAKNRPPLVVTGDHVKPGDRVGVVESMQIPTEVVSFCSGQIVNIFAEEGQPVEYGQPLFAILPAEESADQLNA